MDWDLLLHNLLRLVIAFALALPAAWDREKAERSAGLRTFPLVAISSCGFMLLARSTYGGTPEAEARILQGLITGIGFVGGGAILRDRKTVRGTATATSIWTMGAVGAAVSYHRYDIALLLSFACFAILRWLEALKPGLRGERAEES